MKYSSYVLIVAVLFLFTAQGSAADFLGAGKAFSSPEVVFGTNPKAPPKKQGFFSRLKEKSQQAREKRISEGKANYFDRRYMKNEGISTETPTHQNMCQTTCAYPRSCHLSAKEYDYCKSNCGTVDINKCISPAIAQVLSERRKLGRSPGQWEDRVRDSETYSNPNPNNPVNVLQGGKVVPYSFPSNDSNGNQDSESGRGDSGYGSTPPNKPVPSSPDNRRVWQDGQVVVQRRSLPQSPSDGNGREYLPGGRGVSSYESTPPSRPVPSSPDNRRVWQDGQVVSKYQNRPLPERRDLDKRGGRQYMLPPMQDYEQDVDEVPLSNDSYNKPWSYTPQGY